MSEQFEKLGYFEQLFSPETCKVIGIRDVELGNRKIGHEGEIPIEVVGTIEVRNGHKIKRVHFKEPTTLLSTIYPICGRRI